MIIGKILKAQGIKGELKLKVFFDDASKIAKFSCLIIDNKEYKIDKVRYAPNSIAYVKFFGIDDRTFAETFTAKDISTNEEIPLEKDEYLIDDIIGSKLLTEDRKELGKVTSFENYGASTVVNVNYSTGMSFSFPLIDGVIIEFNVENKEIIVNEQKLKEISVCE